MAECVLRGADVDVGEESLYLAYRMSYPCTSL